MDLGDRPFIAIWETTQACDLACQHCRASARLQRDASELTTFEAQHLLDDLRAARVPLVVLTGGDPAKRTDLVELVQYGTDIGLHMALTPSATPLVTSALLESLSGAGLRRLAISIDGASADVHDAFRGVRGSFDEALRILTTARKLGIPLQVNTTVHAGSAPTLGAIAELVAEAGVVLWSVFFVVPTGRASAEMLPSATRVEELLEELAVIARAAPFALKTTAAPHYRRVLIQMQQRQRLPSPPREAPENVGAGHSRVRINDGRGFLFVSHRGDVFPSGFLPIPCGNVRTESAIDVYRNHALFRALRDPEALEGKCGACEYRSICGGSRGRAYSLTGNPLGWDPLCAYVPPGYGMPSSAPARARHRHLEMIRG